MDDMNNYKKLSRRSLEIVWDWCEENENTPLANAYMCACASVGSFKLMDILNQIDPKWTELKRKTKMKELVKARDIAFMYRDTLGRVIFDFTKEVKK